MTRTTAVYIRSLAYSGTTWVNLLLGSHPRTFALGVPDRLWSVQDPDREPLCSIHGVSCEFWKRFYEGREAGENAVERIARLSGKNIVIFNNINMQLLRERVQIGPVELKSLVVLRDGRANVTSALRHTPELFRSRYHAIRTWLQPAWTHLLEGLPTDRESTLVVQYESLVEDPVGQLERLGDFLGVSYAPHAVRYWEHEHHLIGGNTGTLAVLRDLRGLPRSPHARENYYRELVDRLRRAPDRPILDESWKQILARDDRLAYDYLVGALHERFGYPRDDFTSEERAEFRRRFDLPADPAQAPDDIRGFTAPPPVAPPPAAGRRPRQRWISRLARLLGR